MRKTLTVLVLAFCTVASLTPARAQVTFSLVQGFATKTGFRVVIAWEASDPVEGRVEWGYSADALDKVAAPLGNLVDRAQVALIELEDTDVEKTIYYRVVDRESGGASSVRPLAARNAYTNYSSTVEKYTLNALVHLDSPDPEAAANTEADWNLGLKDIADGINVFAERLYDALDGHARVGKVLITDAPLDYPPSLPTTGTACATVAGHPFGGTPADFLIQTTVPFDSHTWSDWMIEDRCTGFYIGRLGQLVRPWEDDLHLGYIMTHEFMHYAFNAPDLYPQLSEADCKNVQWDGSLMHNEGGWENDRWNLTELDRSATLTPCDHGDEPWTWTVLREKYTRVPEATSPPDRGGSLARGNPDGGALEIYILQHGAQGDSTLRRYTPDDGS